MTLISTWPLVYGGGPDTLCCSGQSPAMRRLLHLSEQSCLVYSKMGHWFAGSNRHSAVCLTSFLPSFTTNYTLIQSMYIISYPAEFTWGRGWLFWLFLAFCLYLVEIQIGNARRERERERGTTKTMRLYGMHLYHLASQGSLIYIAQFRYRGNSKCLT